MMVKGDMRGQWTHQAIDRYWDMNQN